MQIRDEINFILKKYLIWGIELINHWQLILWGDRKLLKSNSEKLPGNVVLEGAEFLHTKL